MGKFYSSSIDPRGSILTTNEGFLRADNGEQGGVHWTCSLIKDNERFYFDSYRGSPDKFVLKQITKLISYNKYKIQELNSRLCGRYCLYFFHPKERIDFYNAFSYLFLLVT